MSEWLLANLAWRNVLRLAGLFGILYLVVVRDHPDPTLILAMAAMMGLPTFLGLDKLAQHQEEEKKDPPHKEEA